jgi:hypothetical protein
MSLVRLYAYSGKVPVPGTAEREHLLKEPYLASEAIEVGAERAVSSGGALASSPHTKLLVIEADPGLSVAYEINPPHREGGRKEASMSSPRRGGSFMVEFGQGCTISLRAVSMFSPGSHTATIASPYGAEPACPAAI